MGSIQGHAVGCVGALRACEGWAPTKTGETPRAEVTLATQIPEAKCRQINLGYRDPATINPEDFANREDEGILLVPTPANACSVWPTHPPGHSAWPVWDEVYGLAGSPPIFSQAQNRGTTSESGFG